MKKRIVIYLLSAVAALGTGAALCPVQAQQHIVFTPHWRAQAQFAGYYVAKEMGFYADEGLVVDIIHPTVTQSPLQSIQSGQCQVITMQIFQALEACDKGCPVVNILQTSMNSGTLVISRCALDSLRPGARIGTWVNADVLINCYARREQLDCEWIRFVSAVNLFIKGGIDAMTAMSYSEYYQLLQAGIELPEDHIFRMSEHGYNIQEDGVYMTAAYYRTHKNQAEKFARASRRGWEWAAEHPDETLDIVMRYVKQDRVGTNRVLQKYMLREVLRLQLDSESGEREFRLRPEMVKQACDLMIENQMLEHPVTYNKLIGR